MTGIDVAVREQGCRRADWILSSPSVQYVGEVRCCKTVMAFAFSLPCPFLSTHSLSGAELKQCPLLSDSVSGGAQGTCEFRSCRGI